MAESYALAWPFCTQNVVRGLCTQPEVQIPMAFLILEPFHDRGGAVAEHRTLPM